MKIMQSHSVARGAHLKLSKTRMSELYRVHVVGAMRLAFLLTGNQSVAEDLVHDAFVRLFGRFADLRQGDEFDAYLRRTIINLSRDRYRRGQVARRFLARQRRSFVEDLAAEVGDREDVLRALLRIPHRHRAALVLRYYEDLSEAQAAEVLECSTTAFRSLVARARDGLREVLTNG